jgi:hypothetical protein
MDEYLVSNPLTLLLTLGSQALSPCDLLLEPRPDLFPPMQRVEIEFQVQQAQEVLDSDDEPIVLRD